MSEPQGGGVRRGPSQLRGNGVHDTCLPGERAFAIGAEIRRWRPELTTIRRDVAGTASGRILKAMLAGAAGAWARTSPHPSVGRADEAHSAVRGDGRRARTRARDGRPVPQPVRARGGQARRLHPGEDAQAPDRRPGQRVPPAHNYRFELEFESEELRQKWIASPEHQRVWPPLEKTMTTTKNYPVVLYEEV
jgi:hypothetical protein